MKKFSVKLFYFFLTSCIVIGLISIVTLYKFSNKIDPFYLRTLKTHQGSVIIGTSRAAQALEPNYLNSKTYNLAFTGFHSPFDSAYLEFIYRFHPNNEIQQKNRSHLISVDPWSLYTFPHDPNERRNPSFINRTQPGNGYINLKYLLNEAPRFLDISYSIFLGNQYINESGRLVVNLSENYCNQQKKILKKINIYKNKEQYKNGYVSKHRILCLESVIEYLKKTGNVYLIRLPMHRELYKIENKFAPDFEHLMHKLSVKQNVEYIPLTYLNDSFIYTDGVHIWNGQSQKITTVVQQKINELE